MKQAIHDAVMAAFDADQAAHPWLLRKATESDRPGVVALWLEQVWRGRYGQTFAYEGGHAELKQRHTPRVLAAMDRSEVRLACDPESPHIFWGFAVVEGGDTLHAILVKRNMHRAGVSGDIIRALVPDLLTKRVYYSGDLPDMLRTEVRDGGFTIPPTWVRDGHCLNDVPLRPADVANDTKRRSA